MRSAISKSARIVSSFLVAVVLLYGAALFALHLMSVQFAAVVSDSMAPTAHRGDLVLMQSATSYRVGDVVVFKVAGREVMHRLVSRELLGWHTKGDANADPDPWTIPDRSIEAKSFGVLQGFGWPLLMLSHHPAVAAELSSRQTNAEMVRSGFWINPLATWQSITNSSSFTFTSPSAVSIAGSGDRRLYAAIRDSSDPRLHFEGSLTAADSTAPGWNFLINGCVDAVSDAWSCGWVLQLDLRQKRITVLAVNPAGNKLSSGIYCTLTTPNNYLLSHSMIVQVDGNSLWVTFDGSACERGLNLANIATNLGLAIPAGGWNGVQLLATNRMNASKLVYW